MKSLMKSCELGRELLFHTLTWPLLFLDVDDTAKLSLTFPFVKYQSLLSFVYTSMRIQVFPALVLLERVFVLSIENLWVTHSNRPCPQLSPCIITFLWRASAHSHNSSCLKVTSTINLNSPLSLDFIPKRIQTWISNTVHIWLANLFNFSHTSPVSDATPSRTTFFLPPSSNGIF